MTASQDSNHHRRKHRPLGEQLNRNGKVMHASWIMGLAVLVSGGVGVGGINPAGILLLVVVFLPAIVAYRRDRLSFPIVFASLFLPAWPWAMYKAASRAPRDEPTPALRGSGSEEEHSAEPRPHQTKGGAVAGTTRRHPVWATVLALVAVGMTVLAITGDSQANALRARGVRAKAVVTFVNSGRNGSSQLVDFTTATGVPDVGRTDSSSFYSVGDKVTVVYDPRQPGDNVMMAADLNPAVVDRAGAGGVAGPPL